MIEQTLKYIKYASIPFKVDGPIVNNILKYLLDHCC